jgi:hypothetical protein
MTKNMLRPIVTLTDNDGDEFHQNLKGIKMSDTLIVAWTSKEIRLWRILVSHGRRMIVRDTEFGDCFLKLDDEDENQKYKKVVDCFINEEANDDHIVYALSMRDK